MKTLLFCALMLCACKRIDTKNNEERSERLKAHCNAIRAELRGTLHDLDHGLHDQYDGLQALNWQAVMLCAPRDVEPPKQCAPDDVGCMTSNVIFALSLTGNP